MTAPDVKMIPLPAELSVVHPGFAPRVAWLGARFGGVPLPIDPRDFVECIAAIRAKFEFRVSKQEANNLIDFGVKLHRAAADQAPVEGHSGIHPSVPVPLELLLFTKVTDFPSIILAQARHGGIPVPVEAAHFEACSNLVASVIRFGGKPTKTVAAQFWTDIVDATEYPRLAGIVLPPPKAPRPLSEASNASAKTAISVNAPYEVCVR